jgi:hypothetical protein
MRRQRVPAVATRLGFDLTVFVSAGLLDGRTLSGAALTIFKG